MTDLIKELKPNRLYKYTSDNGKISLFRTNEYTITLYDSDKHYLSATELWQNADNQKHTEDFIADWTYSKDTYHKIECLGKIK